MDNFEFLQKYQKLQYSIMFDHFVDMIFAQIGYSDTDKSPYWNLALVNEDLLPNQIVVAEKYFREIGRNPTFYFENSENKENLIKILGENGYKKSFEDSWQFWPNNQVNEEGFDMVRPVRNEKELDTFLFTFNKCYQKDDEQNPYGELGDYLKVAEKAWIKHHATGRLEYFTIYKGTEPVAVSTLTNFDGIGYISNVGSLKEVRGEGFGKVATLYCVQKSLSNKNIFHCLATEEGAYPYEFYKRIGFETKFTALGYTKSL